MDLTNLKETEPLQGVSFKIPSEDLLNLQSHAEISNVCLSTLIRAILGDFLSSHSLPATSANQEK